MAPPATGFHPDLLPLARFLPRAAAGPWLLKVIRAVTPSRPPRPPQVEGLTIEDVRVPGPPGGPEVRVRLYRPAGRPGPVPALLWIHGGGYVIGTPEIDQASLLALARELGIAVAAVDYRLAPEHPFPAPLEDCHAALRWLHASAASLGVRADRLAIGGASAGGGLAAALVQLARDRAEVPVVFQLLVYPMLDDRTCLRGDVDGRYHRLWSLEANRFGWRAYLGQAPGGAGVPSHAAPARCERLAGLPPAWLGVGTLDLFLDEDLAYARRLEAEGVRCELLTVPGAYHGFDAISPRAGVSRTFRQGWQEALRRALFA